MLHQFLRVSRQTKNSTMLHLPPRLRLSPVLSRLWTGAVAARSAPDRLPRLAILGPSLLPRCGSHEPRRLQQVLTCPAVLAASPMGKRFLIADAPPAARALITCCGCYTPSSSYALDLAPGTPARVACLSCSSTRCDHTAPVPLASFRDPTTDMTHLTRTGLNHACILCPTIWLMSAIFCCRKIQ